MNEHFKNYPKAIRDEIQQRNYAEAESLRPRKKRLGCWRKLRLTIILIKKPFK